MRWKPNEHPWHPPDWDEQVAFAVRALFAGTANDGQQKTVLEWLQYACGADDLSFRPGVDGVHATDFAEGKRFVWLCLKKMLAGEVTDVLNRQRLADAARAAVQAKTEPKRT